MCYTKAIRNISWQYFPISLIRFHGLSRAQRLRLKGGFLQGKSRLDFFGEKQIETLAMKTA